MKDDEMFNKIGVLGFGIMGIGISQIFALSGHEVIIKSTSRESFDRGYKRLQRGIKTALRKKQIVRKQQKLFTAVSHMPAVFKILRIVIWLLKPLLKISLLKRSCIQKYVRI